MLCKHVVFLEARYFSDEQFTDAISYEYPNERIEKYITKNPNTFAKAYLIGYHIKGE